MVTLPPVLVLLSFPLQLLGFIGTCTQGADGTYLTGAILTLLPLLAASALTLFGFFSHSRDVLNTGAYATLWVGLFLSIALLVLTRNIWLWTIQYSTPCGAAHDYREILGSGHDGGDALILTSYLVLPALYGLFCAGFLILKTLNPTWFVREGGRGENASS